MEGEPVTLFDSRINGNVFLSDKERAIQIAKRYRDLPHLQLKRNRQKSSTTTATPPRASSN